jgi:hypothetical protein
MRKLTLESLQVESFITTSNPHRMRGTVRANEQVPGTTVAGTGVSDCMVCQPWSADIGCVQTYDVRGCGDTKYFDCTYGCTVNCSDRNSCGDICWIDDNTLRCAVE